MRLKLILLGLFLAALSASCGSRKVQTHHHSIKAVKTLESNFEGKIKKLREEKVTASANDVKLTNFKVSDTARPVTITETTKTVTEGGVQTTTTTKTISNVKEGTFQSTSQETKAENRKEKTKQSKGKAIGKAEVNADKKKKDTLSKGQISPLMYLPLLISLLLFILGTLYDKKLKLPKKALYLLKRLIINLFQ